MPATILSGKAIAKQITDEVAQEVSDLREIHGFTPRLDVVRVGNDAASEVYVGNKVKMAAEIGIKSEHHHLPDDTSSEDILSLVRQLSDDNDVDGILVQLPLPSQIDERTVLEAIDPDKDVDGFHPVNVGRLNLAHQALVPCTPAGVIEILKRSAIEIAGKHAVIAGRSNIVGKPMAALLLRENATVTICHSRTHDLPSITGQADILVAAIGRPAFVTAEHIGEGATVIDVGINRFEDRNAVAVTFPDDEIEKRMAAIENRGSTLIGDVNQRDAMAKAAHFTPVPGGVGLLTVAMLMKNTVEASKNRRGIE
ncbi:MAG TPA: bifunctional methylenetetrahydrofolate dehydrogenase/methenyltetrahydrofolate cyclohydrolase FolD [Pyrinomonadaceae bacterium]|mgnify:CR=1 FL=1|nr:bifunctional methylenetetrahydrofolate dehydrogenase/methenyltetrahydrofolate cyclohydrolase FolD [Pyrinomonadaceae bacterium]